MATDHRTKLAGIKTLSQLIAYLRDEMNWPIAQDSFEDVDDLFYDFTADELGIDPKTAAKIESIKRLRPLSVNQPWGIFFVKFEPKKLPVVALRRILGQVALKKRPSANSAERAAWAADDLLFISNYGEGSERQITFAHFAKAQGGQNLPTLKVLGWDNRDTALHLDAVAKELTEHLAWPADDSEAEAWRTEWRGAFTLGHGEVITTSKQLSIRLAGLARDIRDRIQSALRFETDRGPLTKLMKAFQTSLVHDLKPDDFADMYAQTIAYGLLSARIADPHKKTVDDFAGHMRTNPFLRELMETFLKVGGRRGKAGGPNIDFDELGVNEVVELLDDANMEAVVLDFGDKNPQEDPVIHFYELFLKEYDAKKRMQRGVFYTPRPVVSYIVRSVDELLRTEFGLEDGLADTTTWGAIAQRHEDLKIPRGTSPDQAFVQILDPATGTGTFLVEVIDIIHKTMVAKWKAQGHGEQKITALWNEYVPKHLLTRLHAYELLMAPYAIAHLKVGLKLYETGYVFGSDERARIYLTNALEPAQDFSGTFEFAIPALAHEAQAVNEIKRCQRFTVVIGNPPYSNFGQLNKIPFILALLEDYKRGLAEKKLNLDDDYLKFLRLAQHILENSGCGVMGVITNSSFLDGLIHRKLRESLLCQFSDGFVLDLHGNSRRGDTAPDGSVDKNVFEIQQGVAISLWASTGGRAGISDLRFCELWGDQEVKYGFLAAHEASTTAWRALEPRGELYLFAAQDSATRDEYDAWLPLGEVFTVIGSGLNTDRDELCIDFDSTALRKRMQRVFAGDLDREFVDTYNFRPSSSYDPVALAKKQSFDPDALRTCTYRPFDLRHIYYKVGFTSRPVFDVQRHMLHPNLGLLVCRQSKEEFAVLATRNISTHKIVAVYDRTSLAPLWLYDSDRGHQQAMGKYGRRPSFSDSFLRRFENSLHSPHSERGISAEGNTEEVFYYIYAVFYSPQYRSRYADFLKTDYPHLPLPGSRDLYRNLARLGSALVSLHVQESPKLQEQASAFVGGPNSEVERISWSKDTVWIDKAQSIGVEGVPQGVWDFHVGGYRVCEKWLKDRKGRTLSKDDIAHYQKIVVAISETIRLMKEIDEVIEQHGGWPGAFQAGETQAVEPPLLMVAEPEAKYGSDADAPEGEAGRDQGRISFQ